MAAEEKENWRKLRPQIRPAASSPRQISGAVRGSVAGPLCELNFPERAEPNLSNVSKKRPGFF
jgi:hypothetical protein